MKLKIHNEARISALLCRATRPISILIAAASSLAACTATPPQADREPDAARVETVVVSSAAGAPPIQAVVQYLDASEPGRTALRARWSEAHANGNYHAGFRYALALAATSSDAGQLEEAKTILEALLARDTLDDTETGLAQLALIGVENHLTSITARHTLVNERDSLRQELERARRQIEQLTRIEQELEPEPPPPQ